MILEYISWEITCRIQTKMQWTSWRWGTLGPCGVLFMLFVMGMNKSAVFLLGLVSFVMLLSSFLPCHGLSVRGFLLTFCSWLSIFLFCIILLNSWLGALNYSYVTSLGFPSHVWWLSAEEFFSWFRDLFPYYHGACGSCMNETTHFLGVVRCLRCGIVEPLVSRLVGPQCSLKIFEVGPMTLIPQDSRLTCNQVCSVFFWVGHWGIMRCHYDGFWSATSMYYWK